MLDEPELGKNIPPVPEGAESPCNRVLLTLYPSLSKWQSARTSLQEAEKIKRNTIKGILIPSNVGKNDCLTYICVCSGSYTIIQSAPRDESLQKTSHGVCVCVCQLKKFNKPSDRKTIKMWGEQTNERGEEVTEEMDRKEKMIRERRRRRRRSFYFDVWGRKYSTRAAAVLPSRCTTQCRFRVQQTACEDIAGMLDIYNQTG